MIRLSNSTPTPFSGIHCPLCKYIYIDSYHLDLQINPLLKLGMHVIRFYIDNTPIRVLRNNKAKGIPFPETRPMRVYGSIWDAEDWATQGGRVKTNWTESPFTAALSGFSDGNACVWSSATSSSLNCNITISEEIVAGKKYRRRQRWLSRELDSPAQEKLKWVRQNYMVYDYCLDVNRFPLGFPPECALSI